MHGWDLVRAARALAGGGVIAYPTEAVFGIGCDPWNETALLRLVRLKRRPLCKGFIVIAGAHEDLSGLVTFPDAEVRGRVLATWPGPVTWVLPACPGVSRWLTGGRRGLAVRVTAHPVAAALCRGVGPLVSTSANPGALCPGRERRARPGVFSRRARLHRARRGGRGALRQRDPRRPERGGAAPRLGPRGRRRALTDRYDSLKIIRFPWEGFPSGQRDQTVNLTAQPS